MQGDSWTAPQYHFLEASSHMCVCVCVVCVCVCSHVHKRPLGQKAASLCHHPGTWDLYPLLWYHTLFSPPLSLYPLLVSSSYLSLFTLFSYSLLSSCFLYSAFLISCPLVSSPLSFPFLSFPFLSFPFLTSPIFLRPLLLFSLSSSPVVAYKRISSVLLLDWLLHVGGPSLAAPSACWVMIIKLKYPGTYQCITSLSTPQTHSYFRGYTGESVIWYTARNRERTAAEKVRKTAGEGEAERE